VLVSFDLGNTLSITIFEDYQGTLLAILPPGAFIGLGLIVALKNWIDA
jgi:electron transport complex protein RnfE